jgi:hypothetical protein
MNVNVKASAPLYHRLLNTKERFSQSRQAAKVDSLIMVISTQKIKTTRHQLSFYWLEYGDEVFTALCQTVPKSNFNA